MPVSIVSVCLTSRTRARMGMTVELDGNLGDGGKGKKSGKEGASGHWCGVLVRTEGGQKER